MAALELAVAAVEDLDALISTHSLPADTRSRVARSLRGLEQFPLMGAPLEGRWEGFHFLLGPWRWLLLVYVFIEPEDRVVVVTVQDGRSSAAANRRQRLANATVVGGSSATRGRGTTPLASTTAREIPTPTTSIG